jgi:hypothetical protein
MILRLARIVKQKCIHAPNYKYILFFMSNEISDELHKKIWKIKASIQEAQQAECSITATLPPWFLSSRTTCFSDTIAVGQRPNSGNYLWRQKSEILYHPRQS